MEKKSVKHNKRSKHSSNRNKIIAECKKLFQICSDTSCSTINQLWSNHTDISIVLDKIKKLERIKHNLEKRADAIGQFMDWLEQHGAAVDNVTIHSFPGYGLGLRAEVNFQENQLLMTIPRNLIFSLHTAAPELKDIQTDLLIQGMPQVALAVALLIEKRKTNSNWKPYLDVLPKEYTTILYMNTIDLMELKGSPTLEPTLKQIRNVARQYSYLNQLFQSTDNLVSNLLRDTFTYEEYRWAVSTVMTRQNIIPGEDDTRMIHCLIPMWDMCNHEEGRISTEFNKETNCCECYAMRNFKSGDQIFIYYGPRTNTDFFVHSGFVYPDNKSDGFTLYLGISKADPLRKERIALLSRMDLPEANEYVLKTGPEPISKSLLGFLRIFNMDKDQLDSFSKDGVNKDSIFGEPIGKDVLTFILTRLKLLKANYPTSEQEDVDLLNGTVQTARKLVLNLRLSEKRLLSGIIGVLENCKNAECKEISSDENLDAK